jgi:CPA2 family monovalent cation:H+ antiporter-2
VGYSLDIHFLLHYWYYVLAAATGLFILKAIGNILASLIFRWSVPGSIQLGLLIAQGSEFGLILLTVPEMRVLLGEAFASVLVSAIALTLALTPAVAHLGRFLAGKIRRLKTTRIERELTPTKQTAPVLIVGMGQVGRTVADALHQFDIDYFAIERDPQRLQTAIADGYEVEYGDVTDTRNWEPVELSHRRVSVLTVPDLVYLKGTAASIAGRFPHLHRLVVAASEDGARPVRELGLQVVVDDTAPRGIEAASTVLKLLKRGEPEIAAWRQRFNAANRHFGSLGAVQPEVKFAG